VLHTATRVELRDSAHADAHLRRAAALAGLVRQSIDRLREGVTNGRTPPDRAVSASIDELDRYLAVPVEEDGFVTTSLPDDVGDPAAWRASMVEVVAEVLRPALVEYRSCLEGEVGPEARSADRAGLCWLPDGDELYAMVVRSQTSTDLTPDEIHALGIERLATIEAEMAGLAPGVLGVRNPAEVRSRLRDDPALRFCSGDDIIAVAETAIERALAVAPSWFGRLPVANVVVRAIPELEAVGGPRAYYDIARAGGEPATYWANTSKPTDTPTYDAEAVAFHEAVPGHHLQLSIALELEGLHLFRKLTLAPAYAEGWGLYAEALADEMGLYSDDLQRLGRLSLEAMRAARLVVDTGLHKKGWDRRRAIAFVLDNTAWPTADATKEVDRYLAIPGQALSYAVGQREFVRLRRRAQTHLGSAFDIGAFHDVVLGEGTLPLDVLSAHVERWLTTGAAGT
nr:DUF885 domain-containing protein [Actinomycetota bacterium]